MLVKIEARILIFPGTDFHFPSTSVPPGTFFRLWLMAVQGLTCAQKPTQVSLIYRTEATTKKKWKTEKLKSKKRICSEVSVKSPEN